MLHWLVANGLYRNLVSAVVGFVLGTLVFPAVRRVWRGHRHDIAKIADRLDTTTEGGLRDIKELLEQVRERL